MTDDRETVSKANPFDRPEVDSQCCGNGERPQHPGFDQNGGFLHVNCPAQSLPKHFLDPNERRSSLNGARSTWNGGRSKREGCRSRRNGARSTWNGCHSSRNGIYSGWETCRSTWNSGRSSVNAHCSSWNGIRSVWNTIHSGEGRHKSVSGGACNRPPAVTSLDEWKTLSS